MTIVESLILIYTLLGSTKPLHLSIYVNRQRSVPKPRDRNQTARFVEQKFDVNVDDVLIRPLDMHSQQGSTVLYQNLTFERAQEILTKINATVSERFVIKETTVIHLARRGLSVHTGPRRIQTRAEPSILFLFVFG